MSPGAMSRISISLVIVFAARTRTNTHKQAVAVVNEGNATTAGPSHDLAKSRRPPRHVQHPASALTGFSIKAKCLHTRAHVCVVVRVYKHSTYLQTGISIQAIRPCGLVVPRCPSSPGGYFTGDSARHESTPGGEGARQRRKGVRLPARQLKHDQALREQQQLR